MKCSKCGFVLPDDSEFCQYCGVKLDQDVAALDSIEVAEVTPIPETLTEQDEPLNAFADTIAEPVVVEEVQEPIDASEELAAPVVVADAPLPSDCDASAQTEPNTVSAPAVVPEATPNTAPHPKKVKYCKRCGGLIDAQTKKCSKCGKQYFRVKFPAKRRFLILVLILALLGSIGSNIGQYIQSKSVIAGLEKTISNQKSTIKIKQTQVEAKNREINELEDSLSSYQSDFKLLTYGNIGYASSNFKASQSVIVLRKGETKKFTLTANWSSGGHVSVDYSHRLVAYVSFDNDSWYTSTKMTVEPVRAGSTVVTFSNNVNSSTFKILIIVTE